MLDREEGVGGGGTDQYSGSHAPLPPPIPLFVFLPVTSHCWEDMGSFRFKCLPKKKDRGLSSHSVVSQKKRCSCIEIRDTFVAFFFPHSIYHSLAAGTPGNGSCCLSPAGRLPAVAEPGSVAARLAVPTLASSPPSGSYSLESSLGQLLGSTDWYLTWKSQVSRYRHQVAARMR